MPDDGRPLISLVVPVHNERESVPDLLGALEQTIRDLADYRWELVVVDDGSTDDTVARVREHRATFSAPIHVIRLSRNFGHQPALAAGMSRAKGDALVCLDADLQDPPEMLRTFLAKHREGYDVVYGVRADRQTGWLRELPYKLFYRIYKRLANVPIAVDAGDFGLVSRRVADVMAQVPERDLFLRGLRSWVGFKQIGIPYERPLRAHGQTKYTLRKLIKLAASAFFGYSHVPLRIATALGLGTVTLATLYFGYVLVRRIGGIEQPPGWLSTMGLVLFMGGMQLLTIGILGEYIGRIYQQTQARPLFVVAEEEEL